MDRRVYPDFCPGWMYVTSPDFGLKLAKSATDFWPEIQQMRRLDDIFVTGKNIDNIDGIELYKTLCYIFLGYVRERIHGSKVMQLKGGLDGYLWNQILSNCPFLGITKNIFFNDFVISKGSYVNSPYFYFCAFLEFFILDSISMYLSPNLIPDFVENLCKR